MSTAPTLYDRFVHITVAQRAQLLALIGTPQSPELAELARDLAEEHFVDTNLDIHYRRAAVAEYAADGEIEIDADAVISIGSEGAYVHAWVFVEQPSDTAQWLSVCPDCGDPLVVHEVTLEATGKRAVLNTPLLPDGFPFVHPDAQDNGSTSDEIVRCCSCGKDYALSDLAL